MAGPDPWDRPRRGREAEAPRPLGQDQSALSALSCSAFSASVASVMLTRT